MKLDRYLDKYVKIILINDFTYVGKIIDTDENSLTMIDKTGKEVSLMNFSIRLIEECKNV